VYQQAAVLKLMPLNNATQITDAERALIKRWYEAGPRASPPRGTRFHPRGDTSMTPPRPQPHRPPRGRETARGRLAALGLQHVLVMYAGAIAVPLIVGRALKLTPEQVALLISADLFCCGLVTLIQSLGFTRWFGIKLPVMMGVTFAAVGPMVALANAMPGVEGARAIFGAIIGAGVISMLIAPLVSKLLRFFPPVVTGTIIAIIGISLMRVGVGWAMGGPARWRRAWTCRSWWPWSTPPRPRPQAASAPGEAAGPIPMVDNPGYGALDNMAMAAFVLVVILLLVKYAKGFVANISVLLGIVAGCVVAVAMGKMHFDKVAKAHWFDVVTPFAFGMPTFDP
jgi:uracil-xanthine permease